MTARPAEIQGALLPIVEAIESQPADELTGKLVDLEQQAGSPRLLMLAGLLAASRSLDWTPLDASGRFDLSACTVRHLETLVDRLPARLRGGVARHWVCAVSHRIHVACENAPYTLPEVAPDPERMKDPNATYIEVEAALAAGALPLALAGWACCRARVHWSKLVETAGKLALGDSATHGARAVAASNLRRVLEVLGREHRHPVVTALWRALAAAPRGEDPGPVIVAALDGSDLDVLRPAAEGAQLDVVRLADELLASGLPEQVAGRHVVTGASLGSLMAGVALAAARALLALDPEAAAADPAVERWLGDTVVVVSALRDLDGLETDALRPRLVVEAARLLGTRLSIARARGAQLEGDAGLAPDPSSTLESLTHAVMRRDRLAATAAGAALAGSARSAAEAVAQLDATPDHNPSDLAPLRIHVALTDELRRTDSPEAAASFLAASARILAAR